MSAKLKGSKYCYVSLTVQLNIRHLFTYSYLIKQFYFKKNQFSMSAKLKGSKYCYVSPTVQLNIRHLFTHS